MNRSSFPFRRHNGVLRLAGVLLVASSLSGCALIIGRRSEQTDLKTSLNDVLREYQIG